MFIKEVKVENFRPFKDEKVEFDKGINLIIGNNGAGKTSVLSALSYILSGCVWGITGRNHLSLNVEDIRIKTEKIGDSTYDHEYCFPTIVTGKIDLSSGEKEFTCAIEDNKFLTNNIPTYSRILNKDELIKGNYPIISFQTFDREWKLPKNNKNTVTIQTGVSRREEGYKNCLLGSGNEKMIQEWVLKMSMIEFERKDTVHEFRTFQKIIEQFMQQIEGFGQNYRVKYSTEMAGLVFDDGINETPIYEMSTGYKALLSMVMDLAYRAAILNPEKNFDYREINGIVLIDEIDAHLHPRWQWRVIDALTSIFPKVQFIVATHSPIVISSAKDAKIIALDESGVNYIDDAYGYSVDDVLNLRQNSGSMPQKSAEMMVELEEAIAKKQFEKALKVLIRVKDEFGERSPVYEEALQYYELNSMLEE